MSRFALVSLLLFGAVLLPPRIAAQEPATISWRLSNPFRYFAAADTERLRGAFDALRQDLARTPSILEFEQYLSQRDEVEWAGGWGWARSIIDDGDNSDVPTRIAQEACWYRKTTCSDYARPTSHQVVLRLHESVAVGAGSECSWIIGEAVGQARPCGDELTAEIPYPAGAAVQVMAGGETIARAQVKVKDRLVVSMGDSFASGEGNPDVPVRFSANGVVDYDDLAAEYKGYPPRKGRWRSTNDSGFARAAAQWVHRPCHRSLYSQHLRLALHLALSDPKSQTSVTYVGLACTGAEIKKGIFESWSGNESPRSGEKVTLSQVSLLSQILCGTEAGEWRKEERYSLWSARGRGGVEQKSEHFFYKCPAQVARPIDLLLLSIGGNDVGFSRLVASATISRFGVLDGALKMKVTQSRSQARVLSRNYSSLARVLRDVLHISEPERVVLTAYPTLAYDENGDLCRTNAQGMDVSRMFRLQGRKAREAESFASGELTPLMKTAATDNGWTFVESHRADFAKHGICARGGRADDKWAKLEKFPRRRDVTLVGANAADLPVPVRRRRKLVGYGKPAPHLTWWPAPPNAFRPYYPRARWFRTPNDAFLTANMHDEVRFTGSARAMLTIFSAYSGAFHPTAEGHAAIADAAFAKLSASQIAWRDD